MGNRKDWKDAMRGRIEPGDIAALFVRNGYVPLRLNAFGADPSTLECDGLSAIVADRVGYDEAYKAWRAVQGAESGASYRAVLDAHRKARTYDIGLSWLYASGYMTGWDGRKRATFAVATDQAEFDRGHDDGAAGIAAVRKALGIHEPTPEEEVYASDQVAS